MNSKIVEQLKHLITNTLDLHIKPEDVTPDALLFEEGLGLDSIAIVELITLIEEVFHFEFDEEHLNLEAFQDVKTLAQFIASRTAESTAV